MTLNVQINGTWKQVGKDISFEEYEAYSQSKREAYVNKVALKLGVDNFHFKVLDLERREIGDVLLLRFQSVESLDDFVEEHNVSHFEVQTNVLDREIGLVKVVVY